uniref:LicD family protein n=1 Tax=Erysipelothrix tonsillarum TaxID=38402 RepID=A0A6S6I2T6_9FIRM|nr:LicD family protein [Erysipelothrix tonsillarum]
MMNDIQKDSLEVLKYFHSVCVENDLKYSIAFGTLLGAVRHQGYIPWDDDVDVLMPYCDYLKFVEIETREKNSECNFFLQTSKTDKHYYNLYCKLRKSNGKKYVENSNSHIELHRGAWIDIFPVVPTNRNESDIEKDFFYIDNLIGDIDLMTIVKPSKGDSFGKKIVKYSIYLLNRVTYKFNPLLEKKLQKIEKRITEMHDKNAKEGVVYSTYLKGNYNEFSNFLIYMESFNNLELRKFEEMEVYCFSNYEDFLSKIYGDYMKIPDEKDRVTHNINEE